MTTMHKSRKGRTVWFRETNDDDWQKRTFDSISQAKKFNGPNSRTVDAAPANPVREPETESASIERQE